MIAHAIYQRYITYDEFSKRIFFVCSYQNEWIDFFPSLSLKYTVCQSYFYRLLCDFFFFCVEYTFVTSCQKYNTRFGFVSFSWWWLICHFNVKLYMYFNSYVINERDRVIFIVKCRDFRDLLFAKLTTKNWLLTLYKYNDFEVIMWLREKYERYRSKQYIINSTRINSTMYRIASSIVVY